MDAAPPKISPPPATPIRLVGRVLAATALGIAAIYLFFQWVPARFYPRCLFHDLTGLNCPGCGGTRAVRALLHGEFRAALHDNALVPAGLIFLALRGGWWLGQRSRHRHAGEWLPVKWLWPLLAVAVVFGVLRNLPAFAFLSPSQF